MTIAGSGKNSIQLRSVKQWQALIKAPAVMTPPKAIVQVSAATDVTILAFTITGPGGGACDSLEYGVRVDTAGSANILGNHITQIRDNPLSGCQNGVAVRVGRFAEGTTGSARIIGNVIDNYQKNGPTVDNVGSNAVIVSNRIFGIGPTAIIAQNGIQASRGATATIQHNFVSGNVYSPFPLSTGILLCQPGAVLTDHNTVPANDYGIFIAEGAVAAAVGCTALTSGATTTTHNQVRASSADGVVLDAATMSQVAHNKSENSGGGPGVGAYDNSQNNAVADNKLTNNACSGILLDNASSNTLSENKVKDNGGTACPIFEETTTAGIRVRSGSVSNTIDSNHLKNNVVVDCSDENPGATPTAPNTWTNNHGETSTPPGLCGPDPNDTIFDASTDYGWDPAYPWYTSFDGAADFDWVTAYAGIDTNSLLLLLPQVPLHPRGAPLPSQ